jgi:hypothetical protein
MVGPHGKGGERQEDSPQRYEGHKDSHKVRKRSTTETAETTERKRESE